MATQKGSKSSGDGGNSKFRLIVLEADLSTGELAHFAHAITNALRPAATHQQPRLAAPPAVTGAVQNGTPPTATDPDDVNGDEVEQPIETVNDRVTASPPRKERKRFYREPQVIDGLDLTGNGVTWVEYAKQKAPRNDSKRFLTVMAWFKNHGGKAAIGMDEVYCAYRAKGVEWPYGIEDYDGVFRGLVKRKLAKRIGTGQYAINQIGEAQIDTADTE